MKNPQTPLFIILYHHRHGTDAWPSFCMEEPTEDDVLWTMVYDKELPSPKLESDERIDIVGPFDMP